VIRPTRAFLPQIEQSGAGSIVCVNSLLARQPEPHMVATSAARAGVLNLVRSLATEFAPRRIRVNAVLIGLVESGQWKRRYTTQAVPESAPFDLDDHSLERAGGRGIDRPSGQEGADDVRHVAIGQTIFNSFWLVAGMIVSLILGKGIAAAIAGRAFGYTRQARLTMWALTLPQVAATLAATLVGYDTLNAAGERLLADEIFNTVLVR
jgi:NAD(P)-dependent dehydrogenase (short-subunit alcohol dehydrogenase family)